MVFTKISPCITVTENGGAIRHFSSLKLRIGDSKVQLDRVAVFKLV